VALLVELAFLGHRLIFSASSVFSATPPKVDCLKNVSLEVREPTARSCLEPFFYDGWCDVVARTCRWFCGALPQHIPAPQTVLQLLALQHIQAAPHIRALRIRLRIRALHIKALRIQALHIKALRIQAPHIQALRIQSHIRALRIEAPHIQALRIQALRIQSHIRALHMQVLRIQALRIQSRIRALHMQVLRIQALRIQSRIRALHIQALRIRALRIRALRNQALHIQALRCIHQSHNNRRSIQGL
jgi:hypothetical protein